MLWILRRLASYISWLLNDVYQPQSAINDAHQRPNPEEAKLHHLQAQLTKVRHDVSLKLRELDALTEELERRRRTLVDNVQQIRARRRRSQSQSVTRVDPEVMLDKEPNIRQSLVTRVEQACKSYDAKLAVGLLDEINRRRRMMMAAKSKLLLMTDQPDGQLVNIDFEHGTGCDPQLIKLCRQTLLHQSFLKALRITDPDVDDDQY